MKVVVAVAEVGPATHVKVSIKTTGTLPVIFSDLMGVIFKQFKAD